LAETSPFQVTRSPLVRDSAASTVQTRVREKPPRAPTDSVCRLSPEELE
jgi:hypothetical protein